MLDTVPMWLNEVLEFVALIVTGYIFTQDSTTWRLFVDKLRGVVSRVWLGLGAQINEDSQNPTAG